MAEMACHETKEEEKKKKVASEGDRARDTDQKRDDEARDGKGSLG